jgi:arsenate reductase (glutaredoxin)
MEISIYHNPNCSKSREALELVRRKSTKLNIIEYLSDPLNIKEIKSLLEALKVNAIDLIRKKEKCWEGLKLDSESGEVQIIKAMLENRELIERPIVVKGKNAAIGRPIENIINLLND